MNPRVLFCGHPVECRSEMLPDFFGDTPATQQIGTVHCRWCEELARIEQRGREYKSEWELCCERERARWEDQKRLQQRIEELERERDEARPVLEVARVQALLADKLRATTDPRERQAVMGQYLIACGQTELCDAARAAEEDR